MTKVLHIEPTNVCQARCFMCIRQQVELEPQSLALSWVREHLDQELIRGLERAFFCGVLGDPAATPELIEIAAYLRQVNPDITLGMNTNGGLREPSFWRKLAAVFNGPRDYVVFSIDGLEDTNHIYRERVDWDKLMANAMAFIEHSANAQWEMLVFDHNKHQVDECRQRAKELGFTWFRTKETHRWAVFPAHTIRPASPPQVVNWRDSTPDCERDRERSLYLDHAGRLWPCCHMAAAHSDQVSPGHKDIKAETNTSLLLNYKSRLETKPYNICRSACGKQPRSEQYKEHSYLRD